MKHVLNLHKIFIVKYKATGVNTMPNSSNNSLDILTSQDLHRAYEKCKQSKKTSKSVSGTGCK
jgi:hypothetical protein